MIEIHSTRADNVYSKLKKLLDPVICGDYEILRTQNGKPFIEGNPVCFSISHCKYTAVIVICDKPVGIDFELFNERKFSSVLNRFTQREREEIKGDLRKFLKNWVAKEAYIKLIGGTLVKDLKKLEFYGGKLYCGGNEKPVYFKHICGGICAVCIEE